MEKVRFTTERVAAIKPPAKGEVFIGDADVPPLLLRVRASGAKTWMVRYRLGGGRGAPTRKLTIGDAAKIGVADARGAAKAQIGAIAQGRDPAAEKQAMVKRVEARLDRVIPAYIESLRKRQLVKAEDLNVLLTRELTSRFGVARDVSTLTRRDFASLFDAVEASGRPGTAADLKTRCSTFLNWLVGQGMIASNVLTGMRRPRATRAEALEGEDEKGRCLSEREIRILWEALNDGGRPYFAAYVKFLLLTGCRRTEAAALRRSWFKEIDGRLFCALPPDITKNGRIHYVAIPAVLGQIIDQLPKLEANPDLVFLGRGGKQMSGWSALIKPLRAAMFTRGVNEDLRLHDLRKTARSWWPVLGAEEAVCERMISHRPKNTLVRIYDKNERLPERFALTHQWCEKVAAMVA